MNAGDILSDDLWGAVDVSNWKELPVVKSRSATEEDVANGRAVFHVPVGDDYQPSTPAEFELPSPAVLVSTGQPVFAIQAEEVNGKIAVGYRQVSGGNGLCMVDELELLDAPDDRFS